MTDQRALTRANQTVPASATLYSEHSLRTMLAESWLSTIDAAVYLTPSDFPATPAVIAAVKRAAAAHEAALTPASRDEIGRQLALLSTATIPWDQDDRETRMQTEQLIVGLADVPHDILVGACARYLTKPGKRFFPRSAGELREFVNGPLGKRQRRARHLAQLRDDLERKAAEEAERERAERAWTPELVDDANSHFRRLGLRTRYRYVPGGAPESYSVTPGEPEPDAQ